MQIEVALAVTVAHRVDRHAVDEPGEIGAVIEIEAAHEVLLRLAAAGVLHGEQPRDLLREVLGPVVGPQRELPRIDDVVGGRERIWIDERVCSSQLIVDLDDLGGGRCR